MTIQDPGWNMDTGASSHLVDNTDEILERAHMQNCNLHRNPAAIGSKLGSNGDPLHVSSTAQLTTYTDADWAGCLVTRQSTSKYSLFLGENLLSWSSKRHVPLSRSSVEAEYHGVANVVLVPRLANVNVVRSMWLFKHKFHADGSLSRYKARLVANGHSQQQGIDCDETFNSVVKLATIRIVLSFIVSHDWLIHQLDVKNAFLHGYLFETVYMHQSPWLFDSYRPDYVCHLQRSLYGLKTPADTESKLSFDGDPISDPTLYWSLAGVLQYLTFTRPDLSYAIKQLHVSYTAQFIAYTDADWAGFPVTRRSTFRYCLFLDDNLLSWSAKRHVTLPRSNAKAEYHGVANVVAETAWICNFLLELHSSLFTATLVYCDNVSAVYMSANPVQHHHMKHIEIDIHFVHDYVSSRKVRVLHVPSRFLYADIFAKGLSSALFVEFCSSLNFQRPHVLTAREY
nr:ribonuclease H-like domain-containing protein [Tanacetum cinerariifolium]